MNVKLSDLILVSIFLNSLEGRFKDFIYRIVIILIEFSDIEKLLSVLIEEEILIKIEES